MNLFDSDNYISIANNSGVLENASDQSLQQAYEDALSLGDDVKLDSIISSFPLQRLDRIIGENPEPAEENIGQKSTSSAEAMK